jgi:cytidylate kinase
MLDNIKIEYSNGGILVNNNDYSRFIRNESVAEFVLEFKIEHKEFHSSVITKIKEMVDFGVSGWVADGRVVAKTLFPRARYKLYMYADENVRAERRLRSERRAGNQDISLILVITLE